MSDVYYVQGDEFDLIDTKKVDLQNQLYVDTATWGLSLWENFYGLNTDTTKSDSVRRTSIKNHIGLASTLSVSKLQDLYSQYGFSNVTVSENAIGPYIVSINSSAIPNIFDLKNIMNTLRKVVPAHIDMFLIFAVPIVNMEYINGRNDYVDCYSTSQHYDNLIYQRELDPSVTTYIKLYNTGDKNPSSTGTKLGLDKIYGEADENFWQVKSISDTTRVGTWNSYSGSAGNDPTYDYWTSSTAGDTVSYTFEGSRVRVRCRKDLAYGMFDLYIDGAKQATIDLYDAAGAFNQNVFEADNLTAGNHTIQITVLGNKNPLANSVKINIEDIEYHPYRFFNELNTFSNDGSWTIDNNSLNSNSDAYISVVQGSQLTIGLKGYKNFNLTGQTGTDYGILQVNVGVSNYGSSQYACNTDGSAIIPISEPLFVVTSDNKIIEDAGSNTVRKKNIDNGLIEWSVNLGVLLRASSGYSLTAKDYTIDESDNVYILCYGNSDAYYYIIKLDKNGVKQSSIQYTSGGNYDAIGYDITNKFIYLLVETGATSGTTTMIKKLTSSNLTETLSVNLTGLTTVLANGIIGCMGGYLYTLQQKLADGTFDVVKYDSSLVEKNRVHFTFTTAPNVRLSDTKVFIQYGTPSYFAVYNADLTLSKAATACYFNKIYVNPDGCIFGLRSDLIASGSLSMTKFKTDYTEDWTCILNKTTNPIDSTPLIYDKFYAFRYKDKKVLGYIRRYHLI